MFSLLQQVRTSIDITLLCVREADKVDLPVNPAADHTLSLERDVQRSERIIFSAFQHIFLLMFGSGACVYHILKRARS